MPETGGGIGRIKGRCQGVKGGSGHADCVCLEAPLTLVIPWTVACQAPLSIEFSHQEYWRGFHFLL